MKKKSGFINADRRKFMKGTAVAGGAVAAGTQVPASTASPVELPEKPETTGKHAGYRETENVKRYYRAARF